MYYEQEDEYDIGTIRLALKHRRESKCVHSMIMVAMSCFGPDIYRCIKCGKTEEAD